MRMENLFLNILGSEFEQSKKAPSESIYYGKFPYKLKIRAPIVYNSYFWLKSYSDLAQGEDVTMMASVTAFLHSMQKTLSNVNHSVRRRYDRLAGCYTLYLHNYEDTVYVYEQLSDVVTSVVGPIDQDHLEQLESNTKLSVAKSLYFKEYTHKYEIWYSWMDRRRLGLGLNANREVAQFFIDQELEDARLKTSNWSTITLYTQKETFDQLLPFMKMMLPDVRVNCTERYIWPVS